MGAEPGKEGVGGVGELEGEPRRRWPPGRAEETRAGGGRRRRRRRRTGRGAAGSDGPDEHPVPDEHAAADLLEQRPDHAEKVGAAVVLEPRRGGAHDEPSRWREQLVEAAP